MRKVHVSKVKPQDILAKKIFDAEGRTLLSEGVRLTPAYLDRLTSLGIEYIFIEDEISKGIKPEDFVQEETRQAGKNAIKGTIEKYINYGGTNFDGVVKYCSSIIDEILNRKEVLINVSEIRSTDEGIYGHSVNVCALAVITGTYLGYNMLRLKDVAIGALMHDVGKVVVMNDVSKTREKAVRPSHSEVVQKHPRAGYEFLAKNNEISAISKIIVLMHHERCDGTGFPMGLKKSEIHEVARLVAVCDAFDNLVSGKPDLKAMQVYEAVEYLTAMSDSLFDGEVVKKFIENVAVYPSASGVLLSTGEKGIVAAQNKSFPTRPVVRVLYDSKGQQLIEPKEIDLSKEMTLFITGVCDL